MKHFLSRTMSFVSSGAVLLSLVAALSLPAAAQTDGTTKVIHCGNLFDAEKGQWQKQMTLIVAADRVVAVEKGLSDPAGRQLVDLADSYVLPGLIDLHVHLAFTVDENYYIGKLNKNLSDYALQAVANGTKTLQAGFTTVRDCGDWTEYATLSYRNAVNKGQLVGPRVICAGKLIATTGGHGDASNGFRHELEGDPGPKEGVANGPYEAAEAVRYRYKHGADFIKITATGGVLSVAKDGTRPQFHGDELEATVKTAQDYGMHVAAHAHGADGIYRAVMAGVNTIEHGTFMGEREMDLMAERGTYLVPTLMAGVAVTDTAKVGHYPEIVIPKALPIGPTMLQLLGKAYKRGVPIAFGTDAGVFQHGANAKEFALMVEAGMPPVATLQSSFLEAPKVLGMQDQIGQLKPGYYADLVAVPADPLEDMTVLQRIAVVMKGGQIVKGAP